MNNKIKKVVIVGGGTAGWISAALLAKTLDNAIDFELIESEEIGRIGVGEATIPPIRHLNEALRIDEAEFLRETQATIKLAIKFENWHKQGESYFHTFGTAGSSSAFCQFHHYWVRAKQLGDSSSLWDFDLNYLCATANKFAPIVSREPILAMLHAYHFDASLYAAYLRRYSEKHGVKRTERMIQQVELNPDSGNVQRLYLQNGKIIEGDFFIDCSGLRGLLIEQTLNTGYEDWSHWLPCDSAVAVPSARLDKTLLYTRAIAHDIGWQWRIPLQHRNGNGLVYCSRYCSDDEAVGRLFANLDTEPLAEPNLIRFKTGRRVKPWNRNVLAVGLASGFLEPLESTSIHLIQSAIVRLLKFFPHQGVSPAAVDNYNHLSQLEFEAVRDFLIFHYTATERNDSQFWRDMKNIPLPTSLVNKIQTFRETGMLVQNTHDLFQDSSWLQVLLGQGVMPQDFHPLAAVPTQEQLAEMFANIKKIKQKPLSQLPEHDAFLAQYCQR
ncbi:tryptophan halogenase family protein [Cellvibrio sp. NN19]|uniref:tryptophan halogenase family protein n=1 Tax=Cellvibrio chitinivorans TaxID=3102792 RepID=UPI002B4092AB|nr:tryptophan halogenase family protein [Cellvibrio sp. NN19]